MVLEHHDAAFASRLPLVASRTSLANPGYYKFKKDGEYHAFAPAVVHALQKAANGGDYDTYQAYSALVSQRKSEIRDWLRIHPIGSPIDINDVEPIEAIVTRFSTAAMSLGSTSAEAHETLAIAMNRLGGLSNSGEGGEGEERYHNERNSTIKQIASGRFGVTPGYLMSAKELQIKMAQGAKPGEGGQIPAAKVTDEIARTRHTMPGISLISPPPHHDIYSIEDLSQLIYDLKQTNPAADVSVKLVAEAGVGTIAAGVAKGGAEVVHISGHSGGTGAAPLSSIKYAGVNWELGLAESQQTLVLNGLRGRVRVRIDGGIKTGRDVVLAALLGADEVSFGTAALVAEGCVMARTCHSNNCPVGVATQRPELRAKFTGTPEQVIHFLLHVAHEVRELLAEMGARSLNDIIGRTDLLSQLPRQEDEVSLTRLIQYVAGPDDAIRYMGEPNTIVTTNELNLAIMRDAQAAIDGPGVTLNYPITNTDRTVASTLSGAIAHKHGLKGLPDKHIKLYLQGSAGQSLGAFLAPGIAIMLDGEANDYVGKGLAGGLIRIKPSSAARFEWSESAIIGNTCLYGATSGELYAAGRAGERFAVRNSGAIAVVEGTGDHACEYMTGGVVLILGETGRNVAAGMTGGMAYVYDPHGNFSARFNGDMAEANRLNDIDEGIVKALAQRHLKETSSPRAAEILADWDTLKTHFWSIRPQGMQDLVMPRVINLVNSKVKAGL
jgi:glutamate synthase (ferredoxin)